jgi:hypothetical protein
MKHVVTLTAFAACLALSGAAFAHGVVKASSGGHAEGFAAAEGKGVFAFSNQSVYTTSSANHEVKTSTKASSTGFGAAKYGSVIVGGSAGAGSSVFTDH